MSASLLIYPKGFVCSPFANWLHDKGVEIFEVDNPIVKKVLFVPEWAHRLASIRMDIAKPVDDDEVDAVIEKLARLDAESRDAALTVLDLAGLRPFLAYVKGLPRPSSERVRAMVDSSRRVRRGSVTPSDTMPEGYVKTSFANNFERYGVHVVHVPRKDTTAVDRCVPEWAEAIFNAWHKSTLPTQIAELALYKAAENEDFRDAVSTIACLGRVRELRDFLLAHDFDTDGSS